MKLIGLVMAGLIGIGGIVGTSSNLISEDANVYGTDATVLEIQKGNNIVVKSDDGNIWKWECCSLDEAKYFWESYRIHMILSDNGTETKKDDVILSLNA